MQRGEHDVFGVDLEKVSQGGAILAAPEAVRAQRYQFSWDPLGDTLRQYLHVIRCRDEWAGRALQGFGYVGHFGLLCRVEHVPAGAVVGFAIELLVAGYAPHIRRYAVVFLKNGLRL